MSAAGEGARAGAGPTGKKGGMRGGMGSHREWAIANQAVLTHQDHGGALRDHEGQHHVAHLALPQSIHAFIASLALLPTIPAEIVIGPVAVLFPIGVIVLKVVCHQVIQCETVMGNHKIDALVRLPAQQSF